ncbi:MAG: hypothetical protein ACLTDS_14595 [Bianqueaceae bacterium]
MAKATDVPTYGVRAADIGVVGKDVLMEEKKDLFEVLDLDLAGADGSMDFLRQRTVDMRGDFGWRQIPEIADTTF